MKFIIVAACLAVAVHCQSPAFDSFMSRNRQLFSDIVASSSTANLQQSQSGQWRPQSDQRAGRSLSPSVSYAPEPISPFVTSNSHIQAFNAPSQPQPQQFTPPQFTPQQHHQHSPSFQQQQPAGSPTTISGPNFQTSITLPALPALPQHPAGSPAALAHQQILQAQQQAQQQQFQPQSQQFPSNNQFPSSSPQQLVNQQQPSTSFFNSQGNTNFPFNFNPSTPFPQQPVSQPAQSVPQTFNSFGLFNNQPQPQPQLQPQAFPAFGSSPSTTIKAPGFETTFVFMRPSEQQIQGASLSKIIRDPSGLEKQMFYSPMPNYSPPSVYTTQIVHNNPLQQQQGQQV